jgi:hypothetical protein
MLIKVNDDGSTIFPYNIKLLYIDNPNTSLPKRPSTELLAGYGIFYIQVEYPESVKVMETDELGVERERIVLPVNSKFDKPSPTLEGGVWKLKYSVIPEDANTIATKLYKFREAKKDFIRKRFDKEFESPTTALTFDWNSGFNSSLKLDGAKRLAEKAGLTEVKFYDFYNQPHDLSMADADQVIITLAQHFSINFTKKQDALTAAVNATTIEELKAITY